MEKRRSGSLSSLLKGTFFLIFVIFISKILGFVFRMQFMQHAGEEAVGYYMATYPAFIFFISIVQFGLPIAIAKIIAELYAKSEYPLMNNVLKTVFYFSNTLLIIFLPLFFFASPYIAEVLLKNEELTILLRISILAIPFVIYAGIFKSYLQGLMKVASTAFSQLFEQVLRIVLIMFLLPQISVIDSPIELASAVMLFTVLSEFLSFLILFFVFLRNRFSSKENKFFSFKPILKIALPAQGSKLFGTFTWFLEPIIFLKALTMTGLTVLAATSMYGVISGVYIPLLLFPAFIPAALSIILIPTVSEGLARNNNRGVSQRISISLRISSIIGCYAATVFFLLGDEIATKIFHLSSHNDYMKILAPIFYFYYIQSPLNSILQGLGDGKAAMFNSIYGGLSKLFILAILASQPYFQEKGALIAIGFGVLITSLLHIVTLKQHAHFQLSLKTVSYPYLIFCLTSAFFTFFPLHMPLLKAIISILIVISCLCIITNQLRYHDFKIIYLKLRNL